MNSYYYVDITQWNKELIRFNLERIEVYKLSYVSMALLLLYWRIGSAPALWVSARECHTCTIPVGQSQLSAVTINSLQPSYGQLCFWDFLHLMLGFLTNIGKALASRLSYVFTWNFLKAEFFWKIVLSL